jgi:hypothetical protein
MFRSFVCKLEAILDRCEPKLDSLNNSVVYGSTFSYKTLNLSALGTVEMKYADKRKYTTASISRRLHKNTQ